MGFVVPSWVDLRPRFVKADIFIAINYFSILYLSPGTKGTPQVGTVNTANPSDLPAR